MMLIQETRESLRLKARHLASLEGCSCIVYWSHNPEVSFLVKWPLWKMKFYMSHDMTKPTKWLWAQGRLRSAWASAKSNQSLRCLHEESLLVLSCCSSYHDKQSYDKVKISFFLFSLWKVHYCYVTDSNSRYWITFLKTVTLPRLSRYKDKVQYKEKPEAMKRLVSHSKDL